MSAPNSKKVVIAALAGNLAIAVCKFVAAFLSDSTATLAEAVHSLADTGNQALLLIGMHLALLPPTERFPFGRAAERYFWPFIVALLLFSVGGAFAIFEGVRHLTTETDAPHSPYWSYGVLVISLIFEAMSFRVAYREFRILAGNRPWMKVIIQAKDPTIPLVLAEDTLALIGLVIALLAVFLSHVTGNHVFDPIGSISIGILLSLGAVMLAWVTHGLLIGAGATPEDQGQVISITEKTGGVVRVTQILTLHLGPDAVILALKVAFTPSMPVEQVEETINQIEANVRAELPHMRRIFIEPDTRGDGKGVAVARAAIPLGGET